MSRVTFTYKSGRVQEMELRYADPLSKLGHGTYMTRDMQAAAVRHVAEQDKPDEIESLPTVDGRAEAVCPYCNRKYYFTTDELKELAQAVRERRAEFE